MSRPPEPAIERFERLYVPEPNSGCWLWTGALSNNGYGRFQVGNQAKYAHRWYYETFVCDVAEGKELDHLCRTRSCVNPDHLEPVTHRENQYRSPLFAGNAMRCPAGHPYDDANTYRANGRRHCRECGRQKALKWWRRKNARA